MTFCSLPSWCASIAASQDDGDDPLVGGEQVVGVGVEVGDAADHRRAGDEVVAVRQQVGHQLDVAAVALDER